MRLKAYENLAALFDVAAPVSRLFPGIRLRHSLERTLACFERQRDTLSIAQLFIRTEVYLYFRF